MGQTVNYYNDIILILNLNSNQIKDFLLNLDENGILDDILPELTALKGVEVRDGKKHKDNYYHTLQVVENTYKATDNIWLRLASILHDIGKAPTKTYTEKEGWGFPSHEYVGSKMLKKIWKRLNLPQENFKYVEKIVKYHGRPKELTRDVSESALRRFAKEMETLDNLSDIMLFCKCDITTKFPDKLKSQQKGYDDTYQAIIKVVEKDIKNSWRCPVNGNIIREVMNVNGSEIGVIKGKIEQAIKSGEIKDDYESAYQYMLTLV